MRIMLSLLLRNSERRQLLWCSLGSCGMVLVRSFMLCLAGWYSWQPSGWQSSRYVYQKYVHVRCFNGNKVSIRPTSWCEPGFLAGLGQV